MRGFFEHQYLSYKKNHIKNLLALAKIDGHMHEKEIELLFKIAKRYGLKARQVQELIDSGENYQMNIPDNYNDRMNLLYDLVLMVYADEVVNPHEVKFCEDAAEQFGLKKEIIPWLLHEFRSGEAVYHENWEMVKQKAKAEFTA